MEIKTNSFLFLKRKEILTLIMKTFIFLFCTTVFSLSSGDMFSQDVKIEIDSDKTITIDEVFEIIKTQTNYRFAYKSSVFENAPKINLKKGLINAHDLLVKSLSFSNLYYELAPNRTIVLKEKNKETLQQAIKRVVTDKNDLPLSGVSIQIEGTNKGVLTDFDGNYNIIASRGETLIFTYLGKKETKITIGEETLISVILEDSNESLDEVVVTALGVKKEKRALGYAVSTVKKGLIEDRTEGDLARVLSGKVAGLTITNSTGFSGSGTNVVIRGLTSFSGSNQALFVVDGVPFNNDIQIPDGGFFNNNQSTNRAFDIDPNDIAKVEVLKGLAAATLYGAEGVNGVILITTKPGSGAISKRKPTLTVTQSTFMNTIATRPDFQNKFGQGTAGVFSSNSLSSWGPSFQKDGPLGWGLDPNIDENGTYPHPYSTSTDADVIDGFPELQNARLVYKSHNSFDTFFKPGVVTNTNLNFNGSSKDGNTVFNGSFGFLDDESFVPGNSTKRTNISVGGRTKILDKLTAAVSMKYSITDHKTPRNAFDFSGASDRGGLYPSLLITPRSVDLFGLPYENPVDNSSVYFRRTNGFNNPRWLAENIRFNQKTDRTFWNISLDYELNKNLKLQWRTGYDSYTSENFNTINRGGGIAEDTGLLSVRNSKSTNWNHLITLTGDYSLFDKTKLSFIFGGNAQSAQINTTRFELEDQTIFDLFIIGNFEDVDGDDELSLRESQRNQVGVFGQTTFDYDNIVYLNLSARSDWVSNLQKGFNNAIYPSASLSFLPTETFDWLKSNQKGLNYLKLRAGYGTSTRFPSGYPVRWKSYSITA